MEKLCLIEKLISSQAQQHREAKRSLLPPDRLRFTAGSLLGSSLESGPLLSPIIWGLGSIEMPCWSVPEEGGSVGKWQPSRPSEPGAGSRPSTGECRPSMGWWHTCLSFYMGTQGKSVSNTHNKLWLNSCSRTPSQIPVNLFGCGQCPSRICNLLQETRLGQWFIIK